MSTRCHPAPRYADEWSQVTREGVDIDLPPSPVRLRTQDLPARSRFVPHSHEWNQLTYAVEGVLNVFIENKCYVVAPGQALWIPKGVIHTTGTVHGASLSSLYVDESIFTLDGCSVFMVSNLLRALIVEVGTFDSHTDAHYSALVSELITCQIAKMRTVRTTLPWPSGGVALDICEHIYNDPSDDRSAEQWAEHFRMSKRTLARHFERDTGMTMRVWLQKLRSLKSLELLASGCSITQVALSLGYASPSAFAYMFRAEFGVSPSAYRSRP